jgi:cell division protein FtsB
MPQKIKKRRQQRGTLREYVTVAILALLIVWFSYLVFGIARKEEIARNTVAGSKAQLESLTTRKDTLQGNINDLGTERGQEASLRQDFGVARPGEDVIIVVPQKEVLQPPALSWWQRTKNFFGF